MIPMSQRDALLQTLGDSLPLAFVDCLSNHRPLSSEVTEDLGVSVAIQATMAACVFDFTQSLCPADRESSIFLEKIYRGLCSTDPHAVLRWRAMTRSQIRQTSSAEERNACYQYMEDHLIGLLGICGWTVKHLRRNDQHLDPIIHGLGVITSKALDLNKALLEDRVQGDATLVRLKGGSNFDSARADDSFSRRAGHLIQLEPSQSTVLCTTDLGLQITTAHLDESEMVTMLKAKVILEDTFLERTVDGSCAYLDI
ncbi:hypothetical protein AX16_004878 [Volvariella volvacea WC 439]|nr:hypothetical protein AX16_004878 [Volvariella volvacea WC 439]